MLNSLPLQLYGSETARFLSMFDGQKDGVSPEKKVLEIFNEQAAKIGNANVLTEREKELGPLHPALITEALIKGLGFSAENNDRLREIVEKTYPIDSTTEFHTKQTLPAIVGLAHYCAKNTTGMPVCLVEGDFTNIAGSNDHFSKDGVDGRKITDKLMHEISATVKEVFKGHAKDVQFVRAGGDETSLIVYGLEKPEIDRILEKELHPKLNLLAAEYGVHATEHTKKEKLPGFGASFACVNLKEMNDPESIKSYLESMVSAHKTVDGRLRFGLSDEEGVTAFAMQQLKKHLEEKGLHGAALIERIRAEAPELKRQAEATDGHWTELTRKGGAYASLAKEYGARTPYEFFGSHEEATQSMRDEAIAAIHIPAQPGPDVRVPFWNVEVPEKPIEDPDMLRIRKALKAFDFKEASDTKELHLIWNRETHCHELVPGITESDPERQRLKQLVVDLMDAYQAPDPATRCKSDALMLEDAKAYSLKNDGVRVLHIEVTNLSGMNKLDPHLADAVLRETAKYIKQELAAHPAAGYENAAEDMADHVYYEGNGKFKVLLPPDYNKNIVLEEAITRDIRKHILNARIDLFAGQTFARTPKPPAPPANDASEDVHQLYERHFAAYSERHMAALSALTALRDKVTETGMEIQTIAHIPPAKKDSNNVVDIRYHHGKIEKDAPVEAGLRRLNDEAERSFAKKTSQNR